MDKPWADSGPAALRLGGLESHRASSPRRSSAVTQAVFLGAFSDEPDKGSRMRDKECVL